MRPTQTKRLAMWLFLNKIFTRLGGPSFAKTMRDSSMNWYDKHFGIHARTSMLLVWRHAIPFQRATVIESAHWPGAELILPRDAEDLARFLAKDDRYLGRWHYFEKFICRDGTQLFVYGSVEPEITFL